MKVRVWTTLICGLFLCFSAIAMPSQPAVEDQFRPSAIGSVRFDGWLGAKLELCLKNRVMGQDIDKIVKSYRERSEEDAGHFRCEYWGKWFTSATLGYTYQPTDAHLAVLKKGAAELMATQTSDGYIGTHYCPVELN